MRWLPVLRSRQQHTRASAPTRRPRLHHARIPLCVMPIALVPICVFAHVRIHEWLVDTAAHIRCRALKAHNVVADRQVLYPRRLAAQCHVTAHHHHPSSPPFTLMTRSWSRAILGGFERDGRAAQFACTAAPLRCSIRSQGRIIELPGDSVQQRALATSHSPDDQRQGSRRNGHVPLNLEHRAPIPVWAVLTRSHSAVGGRGRSSASCLPPDLGTCAIACL